MQRCKTSRLRSGVLLVLPILLLVQTARAKTYPLPPTTRVLEDSTYASVLRFLQEGDRESLLNLINRNYWIARKALVRLLRQPERFAQARLFAELFPFSCDSELEVPLVDFYSGANPAVRQKLLAL